MQYNTKEMKWFKNREINFAKNLLFYIFKKDIYRDFSSTKTLDSKGLMVCKKHTDGDIYIGLSGFSKSSKKGDGICDICSCCMIDSCEDNTKTSFFGNWCEWKERWQIDFIYETLKTFLFKKRWYKKEYIELFWNVAKEFLIYSFMSYFSLDDICGVCLKTIKKEINKKYRERKEINKLLLILWYLEWYVSAEIRDIDETFMDVYSKENIRIGEKKVKYLKKRKNPTDGAMVAKKILAGVRQRIFDILKENKNKSLL